MFDIIETVECEGMTFAALEDEAVFTGISLKLCDVELSDLDRAEQGLSNFLKNLHPSILARFVLRSEKQSSTFPEQSHSRIAAIEHLGAVENTLNIYFEIHSRLFRDLLRMFMKKQKNDSSALLVKARELKEKFDLEGLRNSGFEFQMLNAEDLAASIICTGSLEPVQTPYSVELGRAVVGVVRLLKPQANPINMLTLATLKDSLPLPYEIRVSVKRVSNEKSEMQLRRRTAQTNDAHDNLSVAKLVDSQEQLEDVALRGGCLLEYEFLVLVPRLSDSDLRRDLNDIKQALKPLGDFEIETYGVCASYLSSQVGFDQHVVLKESDQILPCFLPCFTAGNSKAFEIEPKKRSLITHRLDQSLFEFDLFNPAYDNFSANVIGRSGRGKSVFTNLLTRALHNDAEISIIKIDVGGSHSKETASLNGVEQKLLLSEPSGINPFKLLSREFPYSEDVCNIVGNFLNVLLLEEGESNLTKAMRGEIEKTISSYSLSRPDRASIGDFYKFANALPRRDLLARWTGRGIYRNAFAEYVSGLEQPENRLKYYNFSQIFQANDPDFGQGGLAAVMAQFNLDLMHSKKKLVFIADETPFFIERCFSFFKFSTANVRKFGGSFITIAQKSSDLVVNGDTGIIENSSQKFVFSSDGDPQAFANRLKFDEGDLEKLGQLQAVKGKYSEVLFKDVFGSRNLRISLSPHEYWSFTSSQDDNEKIKNLMQAVPGLELSQAISALSQVMK